MSHSKKLLYIHFEETDNPNKKGILNKLNGKFKAFKKAGYGVDTVSFKTKKLLQFNGKTILQLPSRNLFFRYFIFQTILKKIPDNKYNFIYIRYFGSDRHFISFLKKLDSRKEKILLEFPTYPYDEEKNPQNFVERRMVKNDKKYRTSLYKYIFRAITFSDDEKIFNIPTIKLQNGINIEDFATSRDRSSILDSLELIAVANLSKWHGYDRIIRGIKNYYNANEKTINIHFKIIGKGAAYNELYKLTEDLKLTKYISFVGIKTGKDLDEEFKTAHLAIGSLGMHRIGLKSGSVLKVREYTARGLPTVLGYQDLSIKKGTSFILQVEGNDSAIDMSEIIKFAKQLDIKPENIIDFATKNFSWEKQINKLLKQIHIKNTP